MKRASPRRQTWASADELVEAYIAAAQEQLRERSLAYGRGNAVRALLGKPLVPGVISSERLPHKDLLEFKAVFVLPRVFASLTDSARRRLAAQERATVAAAAKREQQGAQTRARVAEARDELRAQGVPGHRHARRIAKRLGFEDDSHVRAILKELKKRGSP